MGSAIFLVAVVSLSAAAVAGDGWFVEFGGALNRVDGSVRHVMEYDDVRDYGPPDNADAYELSFERDATDYAPLSWSNHAVTALECGLGYWISDRIAVSAALDWGFDKSGSWNLPSGGKVGTGLKAVKSTTARRGAGLDLSIYPVWRTFVTGGARYTYLLLESDARYSQPDTLISRSDSDFLLTWKLGAGLEWPLTSQLQLVVTASWYWIEYTSESDWWDTPTKEFSLDLSGPSVSLRLRRSL